MLVQLPPPAMAVPDPSAARMETLRKCVVGSRAAFEKLLADRGSLSDEELRAIIARLDQVLLDRRR